MKVKSLLAVFMIIAGIMACNKEEAPATLDTVTDKVQLSLDSLDNALESVCTAVAPVVNDQAAIRAQLTVLYVATSFIKEVAFVSPQGIMEIIEPADYYEFEGTDFSNDPDLMAVLNSGEPALSDLFIATEGYPGVADMHPVGTSTNKLGVIEALFTPSELLGEIIEPLVSAPNEIWIMGKDGTILYDVDETENGVNVFTDDDFAEFDNFVTACHTIADNESGQTTYTFYATGTQNPVTKKAWWTTITHHGNEWKIIWAEEK
ncbi:MAG: cache domain-containing protein [Bacteroidota bacterium]